MEEQSRNADAQEREGNAAVRCGSRGPSAHEQHLHDEHDQHEVYSEPDHTELDADLEVPVFREERAITGTFCG